MSLIEKWKLARQAAVPLVAIATPDPMATISAIAAANNGKGGPVVAWDIVRGCTPVNEAGKALQQEIEDPDKGGTVGNPAMFLAALSKAPPWTVTFLMNAQEYLDSPQWGATVRQGAWNLRDPFKNDNRCLVLLMPTVSLPPSLKDDVVSLDEPLPGREELARIVAEIDEAGRTCPRCGGSGKDKGLKCGLCGGSGRTARPAADGATVEKAVDALTGLSSFAAEQAAAMNIRLDGFDMPGLWDSKKAQIEQTRGLTLHRGGETFADIGGLEQVKGYLARIMSGRRPPKVIVWLDEIERTGLTARQDTSGVNQDQEGTLLTWMEDHDVFGVLLLGVPGCGKSAVCKAAGSEFGRVVVRIDLGAMMGSLVGQSQEYLRTALKVIEAVGGNDTLWLATSNSISGLSGAMRNRFTDTFFFDLPSRQERLPIWKVWLRKLGLDDEPFAGDEGWVGRDIRKCASKAWRMEIPVADAAAYVVPVGTTEREEIERLRRQADGRYLSASSPGVYRTAVQLQGEAPKRQGRKLAVSET